MIPIRPSLIRFIRRRERLDGKAAVHRDVHHRRIVVGGRNDKAVIQGFGNSAAESVLGFFKSECIHPSFFSPILPFENVLIGSFSGLHSFCGSDLHHYCHRAIGKFAGQL
jgi:hypothetical protein